LIVVPLASLVGYAWYELSGYSNLVQEQREKIIGEISASLERFVSKQNTRQGLELAFTEAITRSGEAIQNLRKRSALLLASAAIFFFTVFYVLTQRVQLASYIKLRIPGEYHPFYEELTKNVGGALRGALRAVFIDQAFKALVIIVLNFVFGVPLGMVLGVVTFLVGFFPLLGEWAIYIPVSIYLLVFRNEPTSAARCITSSPATQQRSRARKEASKSRKRPSRPASARRSWFCIRAFTRTFWASGWRNKRRSAGSLTLAGRVVHTAKDSA
jgi:predicted PurR-regulated permease PerM